MSLYFPNYEEYKTEIDRVSKDFNSVSLEVRIRKRLKLGILFYTELLNCYQMEYNILSEIFNHPLRSEINPVTDQYSELHLFYTEFRDITKRMYQIISPQNRDYSPENDRERMSLEGYNRDIDNDPNYSNHEDIFNLNHKFGFFSTLCAEILKKYNNFIESNSKVSTINHLSNLQTGIQATIDDNKLKAQLFKLQTTFLEKTFIECQLRATYKPSVAEIINMSKVDIIFAKKVYGLVLSKNVFLLKIIQKAFAEK